MWPSSPTSLIPHAHTLPSDLSATPPAAVEAIFTAPSSAATWTGVGKQSPGEQVIVLAGTPSAPSDAKPHEKTWAAPSIANPVWNRSSMLTTFESPTTACGVGCE